MKTRTCLGAVGAVLVSGLAPAGAAPSTGSTVIAPVVPTPSVEWGTLLLNCSTGGVGLGNHIVIKNPTTAALSGTLTIEGATTAPVNYAVAGGTPENPTTGSYVIGSGSGFRTCTGSVVSFVLRGTGNAFPQAVAASHTYRPFRVFHSASDNEWHDNAIWLSSFNGSGGGPGNDCGGPVKFTMGLKNSLLTKLLMTATVSHAGKTKTLENKSIVKGLNVLEFDMGTTLDCTSLPAATYSYSGSWTEGPLKKTVSNSATVAARAVYFR